MIIKNKIAEVESKEMHAIIDLTPKIAEVVRESGIKNGLVNVFSMHTTAGIKINENEKRLFKDMELFLERMVPQNAKYLHDDIELRDCPPDERINAHAHLKSLFLSTGETIPVCEGRLCLGKWQSVLFVELDGKRKRKVAITVMGS